MLRSCWMIFKFPYHSKEPMCPWNQLWPTSLRPQRSQAGEPEEYWVPGPRTYTTLCCSGSSLCLFPGNFVRMPSWLEQQPKVQVHICTSKSSLQMAHTNLTEYHNQDRFLVPAWESSVWLTCRFGVNLNRYQIIHYCLSPSPQQMALTTDSVWCWCPTNEGFTSYDVSSSTCREVLYEPVADWPASELGVYVA